LNSTRLELATIKEEKEVVSKKLMQTMKEQIASQQQIVEQQDQIKSLQITLEKEKSNWELKVKELTENWNSEKEKLISNQSQLKNSQSINSNGSRESEEQLQKENAALVLELTRMRKEQAEHQMAKNLLIRLNHNFSDLETYMNATLRTVESTREELQLILSSKTDIQ